MSTEWGEPLAPWIVDAMQSLGFERMTPVQAATIPLLAGNKDVVVEAVTGSGKTLAFILPALARLAKLDPLKPGYTNVVIVSPTRELARQTYRVLRSVVDLAPDPKSIRTQLVTGGNSDPVVADVKNFLVSKPHIVVATPGRLLELLRAQHVRTTAVDLLVLDEADRLLDLGVDQTINTILGLLPKQKRVGLFSATMDADIVHDIVRVGMRNPVKVSVRQLGTSSLPDRLCIDAIVSTSPVQKLARTLRLLRDAKFRKAIVYIPTCTAVTHWYHVFKLFLGQKGDNPGMELHSLHGKLQQGPRVKTLTRFTESYAPQAVLLTTDVAARGLDIPEVDLVVQLDMPLDPNVFVHRAGRTARAGQSGRCVAMLLEGLEQGYVEFMGVRRVPIAPVVNSSPEVDEFLPTLQAWVKEDRARHDLALRSFLSFVRYYSKHSASSIFRIGSMDLVALAEAFGVLKMPRMPELRNRVIPTDGWLVPAFDMDTWAYRDAQQERARQEKLRLPPQEPVVDEAKIKARKRNAVAWSGKLERKETAAERRDKRQRRGIAKKEQQPQHQPTELDSDSDLADDWKDLVQQRKKQKHTQAVNDFQFDA